MFPLLFKTEDIHIDKLHGNSVVVQGMRPKAITGWRAYRKGGRVFYYLKIKIFQPSIKQGYRWATEPLCKSCIDKWIWKPVLLPRQIDCFACQHLKVEFEIFQRAVFSPFSRTRTNTQSSSCMRWCSLSPVPHCELCSHKGLPWRQFLPCAMHHPAGHLHYHWFCN